MNITIDKTTILKYDVPGPRYTSYPTAPVWSGDVTEQLYIEKLNEFGETDKTLSIYIHIPFCRSMCAFCACNVVIRKPDEKYADEYLNYLFKEIDMVRGHIGKNMEVKQFHLGGGTPTFLSEQQLERLFRKVQENFNIDLSAEVAIEIDPRTIDHSKVKKLRQLGFNRISMGVQDIEESVQESVNRIQPFSQVKQFNDWCRDLGFSSVNFDLIYGLPKQTPASFFATVEKVIGLKPDRIALYSFAYLPWMKKHQTKIREEDLPGNEAKLDIFLNSRKQFLDNGYQAIAMDHFALKSDELAKAFNEERLYRNFMGYTVKPADEYLGLGVSSISFLQNTFVQNHKVLPEYYRHLEENRLPVERGKELSEDDKIRQWVITSFMCCFKLDTNEFFRKFGRRFEEYFSEERRHINDCIEDGLLREDNGQIIVTELGKIFIRNICMGFDYYLRQNNAHRRFSKTV